MAGHRARRSLSSRLRSSDAWRTAGLRAGAGLGALCLLMLLAVPLGFQPLVVASDSMAPTVPAGSLAVTRSVPADEIGVGDVVSVAVPGAARVVGRVQGAEPYGDSVLLTVAGDATGVPDATRYPATQARSVLLDVPVVGHVVGWAGGAVVVVVGGALVASTMYVVLAARGRGGPPTGGRRRAVHPSPGYTG